MDEQQYGVDDVFHNTNYGEITLGNVIKVIKEYLNEQPKAEYSLIIGTDSQEKVDVLTNKKDINLVTAIVIYRKGNGGRYFWRKKQIKNIRTLREKIYAETLVSLDFARSFVPLLKKTLNGDTPHYNLEIHVDVGEHGDTREMIKEVVGMVTGNGFIAKTKPDSFAASYVADRHT